MDFFILLVLNIFIGAIIFLILSLKIEKTSSTFQEKKMRELIAECDATAERYITLLENRISAAKKLLKLFDETGSSKGLDFTVSDDKMKDNNSNKDIFYKQKPAKIDKKSERDDSENQFNIVQDAVKIKDMFKDDLPVDNESVLNYNDKNSKKILSKFKDREEISKEKFDIEELFQRTDDKYALIASLFADGYSVEELSKYSGLPSGEIKLVITLNSR